MDLDDGTREQPTAALITRPPRAYLTGRATVWVRRGALILTAVTAAACLLAYPFLPEAIPTHFTNEGNADGFGERSILLVVVGVLVAIEAALSWASHYPRLFTYPVSITRENAQHLYRAGEQMLVWKTAIVAVLLLGLALAIIGGIPLLPFVVAGLVALIVSLIVGTIRMMRA
ncbi:DUF1648 domain-containing protein [Leucobacter sp. NPDC058333]|uniref:DUF1648 domain-containing protein n=1 Tax=Leucobacter sp. NPDC058333 TaxID=3346450 RepID=UPI00366750AB